MCRDMCRDMGKLQCLHQDFVVHSRNMLHRIKKVLAFRVHA